MAKKTSRRTAADSPQSAASYVRRSAAAMRACRADVGPLRAERQALVQWADRHGKRIDFRYVEAFQRVADGAEHVVYYDQQRGRAIKATHSNHFGHSAYDEGLPATPVEYLHRLGWHNVLFGDDIRIDGLACEENQIELVTSQPWITASHDRPTPTQEEIDDYFFKLSFNKVFLNPDVPIYFNPRFKLIVADAHDRNVLRTEGGTLVPIDVVIGAPGKQLTAKIHAAITNQLLLL